MDWFKKYKVPEGKPENKFAFNEQFKDKVLTNVEKKCIQCFNLFNIEGCYCWISI